MLCLQNFIIYLSKWFFFFYFLFFFYLIINTSTWGRKEVMYKSSNWFQICDLSQQNRAVVCYQKKCDIAFIWKSILLSQKWYHSCVNWMQLCNLMVKNRSLFLFIFFVFSHTNGVIHGVSWNAFYRQLPCFDVMGHICALYI